MLASELIKRLEQLIEHEGDKPVKLYDYHCNECQDVTIYARYSEDFYLIE